MTTKTGNKPAQGGPEKNPENPEKTEAEKPTGNPAPETETPNETGPENPETPDLSTLDVLGAGGDYAPAKGNGGKVKKAGSDPLGAGELASLYEMVYGVAAARFGRHWELSKEEAKALGEATDAVLEKYGAKTQMGPELALGVILVGTTAPRYLATRARAQPVSESGQGEGGAQDGG